MKKFWKENRVLLVLIIILIVCFVAICSVTLSYFVGSRESVYGDRLTDKVAIKDKEKNSYIEKLKKEELVKDVTFRVAIRTIYVYIEFDEKATLTEAENKATASLENLSEEILSYYDVNFILEQEKNEGNEGFTIMGAKNSKGTGISWNNNTVKEEVEE